MRETTALTKLQFFTLAAGFLLISPALMWAQCSSPANAIVKENCLTGNPSTDWDITGAGDPTIQGFATDISYNVGQTVQFKINTNATSYTIDIYRMGYYGGMGARKVLSVTPSAHLPQTQPACLTDSTTNLVDCGNWAVSGSWTIPSTAVSGIYFAHLVRSDTGGDSHVVFIVRNDSSTSKILFQTADETWQAYNAYGGNSLYGQLDTFDLPHRAYKVSYNRPFITRGFSNESATWVFGAEYPMVRWLESNGYDVTYFTSLDAARNGTLIKSHSVYLSSGHDEYWSGPHRQNVTAARDAGVNLALFSGNDVFWKTRWENSIDGTNTSYRTLVCYKETLVGTLSGGVSDPSDPPTWTGTWRDPQKSPPADGGMPENSLIGALFAVNGPGSDNDGNQQIQVPAADGKMRFWRNTQVATQAANGIYLMPLGTLGYEWDIDADNGFRPAGAFHLSTATYTLTVDYLLDFGATYGAGTATHHMMMYRAPSGALVFGAGTAQWSWALDSNHDNSFDFPNPAPDVNAQQATMNLLADMGVQPGSIQPGLLPATQSTDTIPPASIISSPHSGATVNTGTPITVSGTATDSGGGVVAGVEVSLDSGKTWHPATGRGSWTYTWTPTLAGSITIQSRAADDSGNIETPSPISITVAPQTCPCGAWSTSNASAVPANPDSGDGGSVEVGVKFTADVNGYVTGIRFYKTSTNTGKHIGNLWSSTGTLLATATFSNETASGWQQVTFGTPVAINANTTYVASYFAPAGHYSADPYFFYFGGLDDSPIHLLSNSTSPNGVFTYGAASVFPTSSFNAANYWVDLAFVPATISLSPSSLTFASQVVGTSSATQAVTLTNIGTTTLNLTSIGITGTNASDYSQTNNCTSTLAHNASCTINVKFTPTGMGVRAANISISDNAPASPQLVALSGTGTVAQQQPGVCPCSIWNMTTTPATIDGGDGSGVEVGVKFTASQAGYVSAIRFYKSAANTGTHIGNLWSASGTRLGTVTFTNEGVSGWQQVNFSTPVSIAANTTYVASYYAPVGHYSVSSQYFTTSVNNPPLTALVTPNGVYGYGSTSTFPQNSFNSANYWIDIVFMPSTVGLSPASLGFNPQIVGTASVSQPVTFTNTGTTSLTFSGITFTGTNGADFSQTNNCGTSVAAGAACTINVTFNPVGTGARIATMSVSDSSPGSPQTVSLTGTAVPVPPACPCTIWNSGTTPQTPDSGDTGSVELGVKFYSDKAGLITGIRFYKSTANTGTHVGDLWSSTGTLLATGTFSGETASGWQQLNFSTPVTIAAATTYIASYHTSVGHYSGDAQYFASEGVDTPPLHAYANATNANGVYAYGPAGSFPASSFSAGNYYVDLVFSPSLVTVSPTSLTFASQAVGTSSASQPVTLTNGGTTTLTISSITMTGTNSGDFTQTNTCGTSLAASARCTINVTFRPTAGGSRTATLSVADNAVGSPQTVSLSGTATAPAATPSPASLSYANQLIGTSSASKPVTLTNTGSTTLTLTSIAIAGTNPADFSQTNTCGASLAVNANCTINVTFKPTAEGIRSAIVQITDNAPGSPQSVALSGGGVPPAGVCPCSIWDMASIPTTPDSGDGSGVEVGVNFTSSQSGYITGVLFYKSAANTGTHVGNLWTTSGTRLATGTFTNETASGWQQLTFGTPVAITANTTYVASYYAPVGHYSGDGGFFASGVTNTPLTALANTTSPNGVYSYGSSSLFPQSSFNAANYWVDVVFSSITVTSAPSSLTFGTQTVGTTSTSQPVTLSNAASTAVSMTSIAFTGGNSADFSQTNNCGASLAASSSCTINVSFKPTSVGTRSATLTITDATLGSPQTVSVTGSGANSQAACPCSIWGPTSTPTNVDGGDGNGVEVGVNFSANVNGWITGIRFYKSAANTGTHIGNLWTTAGVLLGTATFTNETATGWQQVNFNLPVQIAANTTYVASYYAPVGHYSGDGAYFTNAGVSSPPLQALANSVVPNGVYSYGSGSSFPQSSFNAGNYWVDVVFNTATQASPTTLAFGAQTAGTTSPAQIVTLTNAGSTTINISTIAITGTNNGDFGQTNTCGATLAGGSSCTINVTFTPTATGARSASLTVTDTDPSSPQIVALSGTGQ